MKTPVKLGLFALSLLLVFAVAWGAGHLIGPTTAAPVVAAGHDQGHDPQPEKSAQPKLPGGLQISQDGYRLELISTQLSTEGVQPLSFRVMGPDGKPVTSYTPTHDKDLHLIVVRRDLTGFQHVHPVMSGDGVWSLPIEAANPGQYRVFADFQPAVRSDGLILGADLAAPGDYRPVPLSGPSRTASVDDYTVTVDGDLVAGTSSKLTLTVAKAGAPVIDLQPYLGAFGHLVALRDGDLAYLHVHPQDGSTAGPQIVFYAEVPSDGRYALFLDFQHQGTVRTARFTATAGAAGAQISPVPSPMSSHGH